MKIKMYAMFDSAIGEYNRPVFFQTHGQAERSVRDEVARADSELGKHPEDYALFYIGEYDGETAAIETVEPMCVVRCHELGVENG